MILQGDALTMLQSLPDESVDMAMTSPPYYCVRSYLAGTHPDKPLEIGLEPSSDDYLRRLLAVFSEVKRVLRAGGTCWVNLADSYSGSNGGLPSPMGVKLRRYGYTLPPRPRGTIPRKSLCLIPYRFAIAMVRQGWLLRNVIIWNKPNAVPESVTDRFTNDFEYLFFFAKSPRYYFKQQFEAATNRGRRRGGSYVRNKRCVWPIPTKGFAGNHFAAYPDTLVEVPIAAGCPQGGIVLDPFLGSGTTALAARRLGRRWIGIELNPAYVTMAEQRLAGCG